MRKDICYKCKKDVAGESREISFIYCGLAVTIFKDERQCPECAQKLWIENFKKYSEGFITISKSNKPKVKWSHYLKVILRDCSKNQEDMLNHLLISLGILSLEPTRQSTKNWKIVVNEPIGRAHLIDLSFFTRKEDAIEFAGIKYSNTLYKWEILCGSG